ncbi:MAG TPA: hypothetical protein VNS88_09705 [Nitrospiraceae bacterium]|nr:hypothetical protein [Nitrospiraceae bacterium]
MTYSSVLPQVFPYFIDADPDEISALSAMLILPRQSAPNGSSYAVTSDARVGKRRLWLSDVSFQTLIGMRVVPGVYRAETSKRDV